MGGTVPAGWGQQGEGPAAQWRRKRGGVGVGRKRTSRPPPQRPTDGRAGLRAAGQAAAQARRVAGVRPRTVQSVVAQLPAGVVAAEETFLIHIIQGGLRCRLLPSMADGTAQMRWGAWKRRPIPAAALTCRSGRGSRWGCPTAAAAGLHSCNQAVSTQPPPSAGGHKGTAAPWGCIRPTAPSAAKAAGLCECCADSCWAPAEGNPPERLFHCRYLQQGQYRHAVPPRQATAGPVSCTVPAPARGRQPSRAEAEAALTTGWQGRQAFSATSCLGSPLASHAFKLRESAVATPSRGQHPCAAEAKHKRLLSASRCGWAGRRACEGCGGPPPASTRMYMEACELRFLPNRHLPEKLWLVKSRVCMVLRKAGRHSADMHAR